MNILYLTTHLNTGGITSYLLALAKGMKAKGHQVYLASSGGELLPRFQDAGVIHLAIPIRTKCEFSPRVMLSFFKLAKEIKAKEIDLLHANTRVTQVLAHLLSRFIGKPYVSTCHGFFKARFSRRIFPYWGEKVIAISQQVKDHLTEDFKLKEADVQLINNGVDVNRFGPQATSHKPQAKEKFGLGEGPVVGIVARLSDVKGHAYLIAAMPEVLKHVPAAQLLIIGEGRLEPSLRALARQLKIEKNTFFVPVVPDTAEALSVIDVFVMPSLNEGLGLGLMEAMAAGIAVAGSDVGGIRGLIRDADTGLLVKPGDTAGLAKAITMLLNDRQKREFLGRNAREFIRANFSLGAMLEQTGKFYLTCLSEKN